MRDEKEERKKQARSNKQTRQSNTCTCPVTPAVDAAWHWLKCVELQLPYL